MITPTMFVWGFWITGIIAAAVIITMFVVSSRKGLPGDAVVWREVKVVAAAAGLIGFFLLLLNFEQIVRSSVVTDAKEYELAMFLEAKFATTNGVLMGCARPRETAEAQRACADLRALDQSVSFTSFKSGKPLEMVSVADAGEARVIAGTVNNYFGHINHSRYAFGDPSIFKFETRLAIALVSVLLVLIGLGGSLGEALYQYRQEKLKAAAVRSVEEAGTPTSPAGQG